MEGEQGGESRKMVSELLQPVDHNKSIPLLAPQSFFFKKTWQEKHYPRSTKKPKKWFFYAVQPFITPNTSITMPKSPTPATMIGVCCMRA